MNSKKKSLLKKKQPPKSPEAAPEETFVPLNESTVTEPEEAKATPEGEPVVHDPEVMPTPEPLASETNPENELLESTQQANPFLPSLRDPRLPQVGSVISRQYKGTTLEVKVLESGFEFEGTTYSSLSKLAKEITGHRAINGYTFFKLGSTSGGKSTAARLSGKILKIEKAVVRLKQALEEGFEAMQEAEMQLVELKKQSSQSTTPAE